MILCASLSLINAAVSVVMGLPICLVEDQGVSTQIQRIVPRAVYIHCMGHSLNLVVQVPVALSVRTIRDTFDTGRKLPKFFKYSIRTKSMFQKLKSEPSPKPPNLKLLCQTRWTVRTESLRSILSNYCVILSVLDNITAEYSGNIEASATACDIWLLCKSFPFFLVYLQLNFFLGY